MPSLHHARKHALHHSPDHTYILCNTLARPTRVALRDTAHRVDGFGCCDSRGVWALSWVVNASTACGVENSDLSLLRPIAETQKTIIMYCNM